MKKDGTVSHYPDYIYYECSTLGNDNYKYCGSPLVNASDLEDRVWSEIENFLRRPSDLTERLLEEYRQKSVNKVDTARKVKKIEQSIQKNLGARNTIVEAIGRKKLSAEDASDELERLSAARNSMQAEIDVLKAAVTNDTAMESRIESVRDMLQALSARLDEGLDERDKHELIRRLVGGIKITPVTDEAGRVRPLATVTYLFPPPENNCFINEVSAFNDSSRKK
jgi:hypothetical protein